MYWTEEEAGTKDCCGPIVLAETGIVLFKQEGVTVDRPDLVGKCKGSACMAWRDAGTIPGGGPDDPGNAPYAPVRVGYCGLAGVPSLTT